MCHATNAWHIPLNLTCTLLPMQYLRTGSSGLPAFRRLIGRKILQDVKTQDVVFADGREMCEDSYAALWRASINKLSGLTKRERTLEKQDLRAVRKGLGWQSKRSGGSVWRSLKSGHSRNSGWHCGQNMCNVQVSSRWLGQVLFPTLQNFFPSWRLRYWVESNAPKILGWLRRKNGV